MPPIRIYTTSACPYCHAAKDLLRRKDAAFQEIPVDRDAALRDEMIRKAGGSWTVPQIFIGERHIGGCDDLYDLERRGGLDALLTG